MTTEQEDAEPAAADTGPQNGIGPINEGQRVETAVGVENGAVDEENLQDVNDMQHEQEDESTAPLDASASRRSVRFAPPQDIVSEKVTFDASDGTAPVSVEGIVEYGPTLGSKTASNTSNNSFNSWDPAKRRRSSRRSSRGSRQSSEGRSSLELRKNLPESVLLNERSTVILDDVAAVPPKKRRSSKFGVDGCFHRLFLNPSYSLRKQMLLTFGTVASLTILLVMAVSIIATVSSGHAVKEQSSENIEKWVNDFVSTTSRYVAQALSPKIMPNDLVDLLAEIASDRFAGYPTKDNDSLTPFFDTQTQSNVYPLKNDPLPMDWDYRHTPNNGGNVNADNYAEHVQDRLRWYSSNPRLSTAVAQYTMQGACDPASTNPNDMVYYPNCTDANNDVSTGGVVAPNPTNEQVYRKAADMSPFLKALYEYHQDIMSLGYYFSNSGAGGSVMFPHYELDASSSYESIGCEWMRTLNPINESLGPIGTEEEIARCHPAGAIVPTREYNPLERGWCRDQALSPQRIQNAGPYINAWSSETMWLMSTGRAVYDLVTGAFVSCISVDFTIDGVNNVLDEVKVDELGILTLVRNDADGTVVTSPKFDFERATGTTTVTDPALETGVDQELFGTIKTIVDFSQPWDPDEASKAYEAVFLPDDEHIVAAYPIPSVPAEYDPTYAPMFFALFTLPMAKGLAPIIENVSQDVDQSVMSIVLFTVIIGVIGLVVVLLSIYSTASWFVRPLKWMHTVGDQVVGKFGQELDTGIEYERKKSHTCLPQTELDKLAEEFSKVVARFSGEGTARRMRTVDTEKLNIFDWSEDFRGLYLSRNDSSFAFNYPRTSDTSMAEGQALRQCNMGPNIRSLSKSETASSNSEGNGYEGKVHKSPLFLWMVTLVVIPTLVFTVVISAVVLWQISHQLPSLIEPVEEEYLALMDSYRFSAAGMLAIRTAEVTERAARDTHLITRLASWLFFGGMNVSESFIKIDEKAEECKTAPSESNCRWETSLPCDCAWKDFSVVRGEGTCTEFPTRGESRFLQRAHFAGQRQDAEPDGSRYSISYPFATAPNLTAWWDNATVLPRSTDGNADTPYGTTFDRVKILSALSTAFVPVYNYDKSVDKHHGMYVGFEADGLLGGFRGCKPAYTSYPFWKSTEENGGALIRPELCPIGKFGYDARCRGWYDDAKRKAQAGKGTLHITAPYVFAEKGRVVGQSITSPLIDPQNQRHIGQTLVDFLPDSIFRALEGHTTRFTEGEFTILITPESDVLGHDTVISPGFSLESEGESIEDLLSPDEDGRRILRDMKAGKRGYGNFAQNGGERIHIAFAPVLVRNYYPLNSSDMASGVKNETTLVYSLALAESETDTMEPFSEVDNFSSNVVDICIGVLAVLIGLSTVLIVYIAFRVATSMIGPLLKLFEVMKDINSMRTSDDDITKLSSYKGSCREVDSVYQTMEMLYKVVRFANAAFFSGDLDVAYHVLKDSLRLFTRLDNQKAIAVASNNLGNTMLTIYRTMKASGTEEMCGLIKESLIEKGTAYFNYSIKLGEVAYDEFYNAQGWSEECLAFMQFLANRYFNRAMFFLTTSCDSPDQQEAESLGFRDLQIAGDMDVEIVDQCLEMGFKINRVERYELMMSRVRGLLALVQLGYNPDDVHVEDQIVDVYRYLKKAMESPSHALFKDMGVAGRMQKLDVELIKYCNLATNDHVNAARVAIRMLVEDEYIFPDAEHEATKMILAYLKNGRDANCPKDDDGRVAKELSLAVFALEHEYMRQSRTQSLFRNSGGSSMRMRALNLDISERNGSDDSLEEREESTKSLRSDRRSSAVKESCRFDVTMELF